MSHICLSLHSLLQSGRDRVVLTCDDRTTTAAVLHNQVATLSKAFTKQLSISQGDRIVLLGLNTDVFFSCLLAVLDAGAVACPLNWRWSAAELAAALQLVQPTVLLVDDHCTQLAQQACSSIAASSSSGCPDWALIRMCADPAAAGAAAAGVTAGKQCTRHKKGVQHNSRILSTTGLLHHSRPPAKAAAGAAVHGPQPQQQPQQQQRQQLQLLHPGADQPALIVFTSGTTGASKGVMLSHNSITHQSLAKLAVVQYSSSDVYLHMAPLFHIGGLSSAFAVLMAGGTHVFMPSYSPATALRLIRQYRVTSLIAVPTMMQDLTQTATAAAGGRSNPSAPLQQQLLVQQQQQQQQLPSLQRVLVGAGGMPLRLQQAVAALFPNAMLQTAYGMTEASSSITFVPVEEQQQLMAAAAAAVGRGVDGRSGSVRGSGLGEGAVQQQQQQASAAAAGGVCVGKPGPGIAVKIDALAVSSSSSSSTGSSNGRTSATSAPSSGQQQQQQQDAVGVVGEVCTRGPHVMLGYWRDPQATHKTLDPEGWLHTGDLGFIDAAGNLWLVGRLKDMVKTGGENVHAAEVEGVLLSHPAVAAAAVFGLDHPRLGEQVAAVVVLQPGWGWGEVGMMLPRQHSATSPQQQQQQQQQLGGHGVVSPAVLQQHCRDALLSPYKLPRVVVCAQQLPMNSSGKIVKTLLKQQVQQLLSSSSSSSSGRGAPVSLRSRL